LRFLVDGHHHVMKMPDALMHLSHELLEVGKVGVRAIRAQVTLERWSSVGV
jgi:hypothetical protein